MVVDLESSDNADVAPILVNGKDPPNLISTQVPSLCQENALFIIDLDALENRKDVYSDDNGVWRPTGCKSKMFNVERGAGGEVINLIKVGKGGRSGFPDVTVCRRTYVCMSCPLIPQNIGDRRVWKKYPAVVSFGIVNILLCGIAYEVRSKSSWKQEDQEPGTRQN